MVEQKRTAPVRNGGGESKGDTVHLVPTPTAPTNQEYLAQHALTRMLAAVDEMLDALRLRFWEELVDDTHLEADCQTWLELARAFGDYLRSRRKP